MEEFFKAAYEALNSVSFVDDFLELLSKDPDNQVKSSKEERRK